ncbi:MAG TPA: hypothetical protein VF407_12560 [Polyangiaceae bacterium]
MRRSKSLGLGVLSTLLCAGLIGACSASGNGSNAGGDGDGTGANDASTAVADSGHSYGDASSNPTDSGAAKDSGKPTPIDSGTGGGGTDSGGGGGGTAGACDTGSQTATFIALASFIATNDPPECDASGMCSSGECCLDLLSVASGGSAPPGFPTSSYCVTDVDLTSLGL